jgi:hypothetical protein
MHALAAEQSDAEAEERAGLRPWRMGAVGCMAAKAPGRARRKGSNGRDGLASCMATTRRKRKPHGQRRVAQCERFNCSCGKQSRSDVIPLLSFHMQRRMRGQPLAGSPRTGRVRRMGPKLPHTLTSANNCLPGARCIQATPFGKIDEAAVCAIARSCLDPKNQPVACLAVQHGSGGAFGGDGS